MARKIYGSVKSRAYRVLWMAEELGLDHTHVDIATPDAASSEELRRVNPNSKLPAYQDDEVTLWESLAINLYLARKFGGPLAPADLTEEGRMLTWSFWASSELEPYMVLVLRHRLTWPEEKRNPMLAAYGEENLGKPLAVLEAELSRHPYLVGDRFTVADLNVAGVLRVARMLKMNLGPATDKWLAACLDRPAARKTFG